MYIKDGYLCIPDEEYKSEYKPSSKCDHNDNVVCPYCNMKVYCNTHKYKVNKEGLFEEVKES